ncbi:MAG: 6-pyruvoyl-tetrahydropterin synthase-related protein, partial [Candidatus Hermodarchaeota archaeon]
QDNFLIMKKFKIGKPLFLIIFLGIILIIPSIIPLFKAKFFRMHDYTHVARLVEMDKALKDGHFPVRWAEDLGWGYGMPLFNFYGPLPYYLAEVFHLLGFSFLNSIKIIFGSTFFLAFGGMFLLGRKFWGNWPGFLAGLAFVYSPYRSVDFYARGALGELLAISLIPWVLWGVTEVIDKKKQRAIALNSILLALVLLAHTVLDLICLPLFIIFALFYLLISKKIEKKEKDIKINFLALILSFVLGVSLACFFLLPAFLEKDFTRVGELTGGYSHYSHHFLYFRQFVSGRWGYGGSIDGPNDGLAFILGKVHLFLAVLTLITALFVGSKKVDKKVLMVLFFTLLALLLAFLSTYKSKFIWDLIPLMAFIQFPWRFNSFIIVVVAFLTGGIGFYLGKFINKKVALVFIFIFTVLIIKTNLHYFQPQGYVNPDEFYYTDEKQIRWGISGIIPDYIPRWMQKEPKEMVEGDYQVIDGNPEIEIIENKTQKIVLKVKSEDNFKIQFNRFYFPGWRLLVDNKKINFEYKDNNGIIWADIPEGKHKIELIFKRTWIRLLAEFISLVSFIIIWKLLISKR